jgi:hypothetical protein
VGVAPASALGTVRPRDIHRRADDLDGAGAAAAHVADAARGDIDFTRWAITRWREWLELAGLDEGFSADATDGAVTLYCPSVPTSDWIRLPRNRVPTRRVHQVADRPPSTSNTVPEM